MWPWQSLLSGSEPYDDYDSDDEPEALVGRMINIWWSHDRAFKGKDFLGFLLVHALSPCVARHEDSMPAGSKKRSHFPPVR